MAKFEDLLLELGDLLDTTLHSDERRVCTIELNETITMQLEMDSSDRFLVMVIPLIEIPPGKFREKALLDILRGNDYLNKQPGIFSMLPKRNLLLLHEKRAFATLPPAEELIEFIIRFSERAYIWREAIQNGKTCPDGALINPDTGSSENQLATGIKS